ncbi:MAG TPA: type II secretory pathway, component PulD [Lacunisphaera sp.]|jgi:general secretion pathway protein D|nr:type II secretory pathway, component PulD [Lacunisphaera sp.]
MHRPWRHISVLLSIVILGLARLPAAPAPAETDAVATKIRLLSAALHARDTGDTAAARQRLEELLQLSPNDETVKRLLASLERLPEKRISVAGGTVDNTPAAAAVAEADQLVRAEEERLGRLLAAAATATKEARALARQNQFSPALEVLARARASLPDNRLTADVLTELDIANAEITTARDTFLRPALPVTPPAAEPTMPSPSPENAKLVARGRSQYLAGEAAAAAETFRQVEVQNPGNADARYFLQRISREEPTPATARPRTSGQMLREVDQAWQRPGVFTEKQAAEGGASGPSPLVAKLHAITLPSVNFSGLELSRVVNTLSVISEEFDQTGAAPRGVNIVLLDPSNANPVVNLTLRNLSLKRVLDFITDAVGYQYEVQADAVVVRPGGGQSALETQFFPVSRSTVLRLTGKGAAPAASEGAPPAAAASVEGEGQAIRNFLQLAGVSFDGVAGSTLAFDGSQIIATQTPRNLERIRNILTRYNDVRQVEIEAKFMEVQQGALEELGVQWNLANKVTQRNAAQATYTTGDGLNRTLADAFRNATTSQQISISGAGQPEGGLNLPAAAPTIPGGVLLGAGAGPLANIAGIVGEFDVQAVIRALSQKSGTELLSAPKLTVLSGNPATITVAQELRYPQSYGQIQSQVGTGSVSGGGSAGVSITSGTPQEFTTRNVGVELRVTPTVEEDDYSVSLDLNPKVTEFEGFVEYGGPSVAISGGTTVTVPPGFYQPIFAVREVTTKVTIWDGATLVMGGLTREDVKKVSDKVPVLGSLPVVGRLFRSQGESSQKRNLLIFVTANLVSPGGSLKKQTIPGGLPGTLYQNPTIVTPAGAAGR